MATATERPTSREAVSTTTPREMSREDINNIEPVSPEDAEALTRPETLALTRQQLELVDEYATVRRALSGLLEVSPYDKPEHLAEGTVHAGDGRTYEGGSPPVEFAVDWCVTLKEGETVADGVVQYLRWTIEEHEKLLALVTQRLVDAGLIEEER